MNVTATPPITPDLNFKTIESLKATLGQLAKADKSKVWICKDLSLRNRTNCFMKLLWWLFKRCLGLREAFFGVNLSKSRDVLNQLKPKIVELGDVSLVHLFNSAVANFNKVTAKQQVSPFTIESHKRYLPIVKALLEKDHSLKIPFSTLCKAVEEGDTELLIQAIGQGLDLQQVDKNGQTLLHLAVQHGQHKVLDLLLKVVGCDPNLVNNQGDAPIHSVLAEIPVNENLLACLVDHKASITVPNSAGKSAIDLVLGEYTPETSNLQQVYKHLGILFKGNKEVITHQDENGESLLFQLLKEKQYTFLPFFLTQCTPEELAAQNVHKKNLLHVALETGAPLETVDILVVAGISTIVKDMNGYTPLHLAVHKEKLDILEMFLKNPVDEELCNTTGPENRTLLHESLLKKQVNLPLVDFLLSLPIDVNALDSNQKCALHMGLTIKSKEVVGRLLKKDEINVNFPTKGGMTPLHLAIVAGDGFVKLLLQNKSIDLDQKNGDQRTPFEFAEMLLKEEAAGLIKLKKSKNEQS